MDGVAKLRRWQRPLPDPYPDREGGRRAARRGRAPAEEVAESAEEGDATVDRGWLWHGDGFSLLLKLEHVNERIENKLSFCINV